MLHTYLNEKSPEHSRFRSARSEHSSSSTCINLSCRMLAQAVNQNQHFYIQSHRLDKVTIIGKLIKITYAKSPKGIEMTDLHIKDDTYQTLIVSIYKNEFPNDHILNLLQRTSCANLNQLLGRYLRCRITIKKSTNKFRPYTYICYQIDPIVNFNDITIHRLEIIHDHCGIIYGEVEEKGQDGIFKI